MEIREIKKNKKQYLRLLLLADEQESMIDRYLEKGTMYVLDDGGVKSECVVTDEGGDVLEIKNIATEPEYQRKGYGRALIEHIVEIYRERFSEIQVGTGDSPLTMPFYEKCGFVRSHIVPNFFTKNYDHPIYEGGVQLIDMVYLRKRLYPIYIFRALNKWDCDNLQKGIFASYLYDDNGILQSTSILQGYNILEDIGSHVANGSSKDQKDCWISTCKSLDVCLTEYSLPQGGGYNTASGRKNAAVIAPSYWKKIDLENDCYTVFKEGNTIIVDFMDEDEKLKKISNLKEDSIPRRIIAGRIQDIRSIINGCNIDSALFDCSFSRGYNVIRKLDIMSFSKAKGDSYFGLFDRGLTAVQNGICKAATEVLCLNQIPAQAIKAVLTPIQQDMLYMIKNEAARMQILDALIAGKIDLAWDPSRNEIRVGSDSTSIQAEPWLYPGLVYETLTSSSPDIEADYNSKLGYKEGILSQALSVILKGLNLNAQITIGSIPERDGLIVCDFDAKTYTLTKKVLYDVAAIKWKNELYFIRKNDNYNEIGLISKNNALLIELDEQKRLICPELKIEKV